MICGQKHQSGTLDLRSEVSNVQDQGGVFVICGHKRQRRTLDLRSEVSLMPPAGLEPATHGLRVHCSTN